MRRLHLIEPSEASDILGLVSEMSAPSSTQALLALKMQHVLSFPTLQHRWESSFEHLMHLVTGLVMTLALSSCD